MRLTDISIKALKAPEKGAVVYPDAVITGFGVRVSEGGTKSFVLTHGKLRKRETIGRVGILDLKDARSAAKKLLAAYTLGKTSTTSVPWNMAVEGFLKERKGLKARTLKDYERLLKRHFRFGDLKVSEITTQEIQRRIDKLSGTPVEQHHAFVVLRTFFRWTHRKYYVETNPMDRLQSSFKYKPRERILSDVELKKVWRAAGDDTFGTIVKLLILTGQRSGEITKLSRAMLGKNSVTLPSWLTKNGREHTFPVGSMTVALLKRIPFATLPNFARYKGYLDERSGVTGYTLHDLRRTLRSKWAELGVVREVAEKYINHVSGAQAGVNGIYDRYSYMKEMQQAVELWEAHVQTLIA